MKADDLDLRPIRHWTEDRVRGHVLTCTLAAYLVWHLRHAWAPLVYTDPTPPARVDPVAPARRSPATDRKASCHRDDTNQPIHTFRGLLDHRATLTRNHIHLPTGHDLDLLASPPPPNAAPSNSSAHPSPSQSGSQNTHPTNNTEPPKARVPRIPGQVTSG